jgi:hypothetical protein
MSGDEDVFIGVAPGDGTWYLRFYLAGDDEGFDLLGRFDITLAHHNNFLQKVAFLCLTFFYNLSGHKY